MDTRYPIHDLIVSRLAQLGIRRGELARRCGYKSVSKGLRRIDALCAGAEPGSEMLDALAIALEIDRKAVDAAARATSEIIAEAERQAAAVADAAWRAAFVPHGYLKGSQTRPSQITIYGISGGPKRWLLIKLDATKPAFTFATQALAVVKKTPCVPFFGATTGFVINYSPDTAVRFDLEGNPVKHLDRAYSPGDVAVLLGARKPIPPSTWAALVGRRMLE
jgi:hypothetical protein